MDRETQEDNPILDKPSQAEGDEGDGSLEGPDVERSVNE